MHEKPQANPEHAAEEEAFGGEGMISALFSVFLEVLISRVQVQNAASARLYLAPNSVFNAAAGSGERPRLIQPADVADNEQIY